MSNSKLLGAYFALASDGKVAIRMGKVELGQGIGTALAKIAAQALELPLSAISLLPANTRYSVDEGFTSGSLSVQQSCMALRKACLFLRSLCLEKLGHEVGAIDYAAVIDPAWWQCEIEDVDAAPSDKISRPVIPGGRVDLPARVRGEPVFIHDMVLPNLLHARVVHAPRLEARLVLSDAARALIESLSDSLRQLDGVVAVLQEGQLLAVVTKSEALAKRCHARLDAAAQWEGGRFFSNEDAFDALPKQTLDSASVFAQEADGTKASLTLTQEKTAAYFRPAIAHASMAPSCALARWDGQSLEVWTHGQGVFPVRKDLALAFGLTEAQVVVQHAPGAGCYGHNGADDAAFDAAWLAMKFKGQAIRLQWTHEQELSRAPLGARMRVDVSGALAPNGKLASWTQEVFSSGHSTRPGRAKTPSFLGAWALGQPVLESINMPLATGGGAERNALPTYDLTDANVLVKNHRVLGQAMRSSALRSLGAFANVFAAESMVDELLDANGDQFPAQKLQWRIAQQPDARAKAVLEALSKHLPSDVPKVESEGWGIGYARYKNNGAYCAVLARVHVQETLRVKALFIAVDVGEVIDHDGVVNQIEGGAIQATSWALKEAVTHDTNGITSADWETYPILRFSEVPAVQVDVVPSNAPAMGAGEASMGPTAAAIANALHDAIGLRVRHLPLTTNTIFKAIHDN